MSFIGQTPTQAYKDGKKSFIKNNGDTDENKYTAWTPNSFKISSPKSSAYGGSNTHRENRNKVAPFTEHLALPPRHDFQKTHLHTKPDYRKVNTAYRKNSDVIDKKEYIKPATIDTNVKKEKFFEYVLKYSYRSKKGYIPNSTKTNQDAYIINTSIGKKSWQHYFGICDGHGSLGHHVSSFIKANLPKAIDNVNEVDKSHVRDALYKAFRSTN